MPMSVSRLGSDFEYQCEVSTSRYRAILFHVIALSLRTNASRKRVSGNLNLIKNSNLATRFLESSLCQERLQIAVSGLE